MNTDERELLRTSLGRLLAETDTAKVIPALAEFGWFDLLAAEPHEAVPALFEIQGETLRTTPALGAVMALATGDAADSDPPATAVLPGPGAGAEPRSVVSGGTLLVDGCVLAGAEGATRLVTVARRGDDLVLATGGGGDGLLIRPVEGIDPWLEMVRLAGRVEVVDLLEGPAATEAWERAVAAGRRALAHELLGTAATMLRLAVEHATERHQFGRRIGSFQAIQHRLAEARVALTAAELAAAEAWAGPEATSALLAKLWAGRAGRLVGKQAQQTLGGMGFTWEHPFHRSFRRALALDSLLGSAPELTAEIGRRLISTRTIPQLASV
jgi:hypothetical protein